ncbi:MAG TPA: RidA family protein [Candidatus Dormibacteraeota bacterium]
MTVDERIAELGIVIPDTTAPVANYVSTRRSGNLLFVSGHISKRDGVVVTGTVGDGVETEAAYELARLAALDVLGTIRAAVGSLDDITLVKITGFVHSAPGFSEQSAVINGASDLFVQVLGAERGAHARSAIGVVQLPLDAAVEVEAIVEISVGSDKPVG